jgi:3-oxoisoapionate kinase
MHFKKGQPSFTYYGDDFTGSTDALEALASNGVRTVLFLEMPDDARLKQFGECNAIGLAGESRSRSPEWMSAHLPDIFRRLNEIGGSICQYKVCSTFDSSPEIGNIGRALEIGAEIFGSQFVPIFAAAPHLRRYVAFGHLFAADTDRVYRIDRHPTMSRHPVTPMNEGDLRLHLARQTNRELASFNIVALDGPDPDSHLDALLEHAPAGVLFDGFSGESVQRGSGLVWERRSIAPFVIGSSGFTYGLAAYWRSKGLIPASPTFLNPGKADRLIVMSGSCSPVTENQIRWALTNGFAAFRIDPAKLMDGGGVESQILLDNALRSLQSGTSVVLHSALGPKDCTATIPRDQLGVQMGRLLRELLLRSGVRRAIIAGGDTASHAGRQLGLYALTLRAPLAPGAPLCEAHTENADLRGLELVLKGGQVGLVNFFQSVQQGTA